MPSNWRLLLRSRSTSCSRNASFLLRHSHYSSSEESLRMHPLYRVNLQTNDLRLKTQYNQYCISILHEIGTTSICSFHSTHKKKTCLQRISPRDGCPRCSALHATSHSESNSTSSSRSMDLQRTASAQMTNVAPAAAAAAAAATRAMIALKLKKLRQPKPAIAHLSTRK